MRLNSARNKIELAFGRLKSRWRMLSKRSDINYTFMPTVITVACILHNIIEDKNETFPEKWSKEREIADQLYMQPLTQPTVDNESAVVAKDMRDHLCKYLFENFDLRESSFLHP